MRSKRSRSRRNLSSQANTRSIVRKRSSKMAGSKIALRPRFGCFPPRGLGLMLGTMPRLKIALSHCDMPRIALCSFVVPMPLYTPQSTLIETRNQLRELTAPERPSRPGSVRREYRSAEDSLGQQVIELYHHLSDDAETTAGGLVGGYRGLDGQFPAPAPGVADARGDLQGLGPAAAGSRRRGVQHLDHRGHAAEEWRQVNVRDLRHEVWHRILDGEARINCVG